MKNTYETTLSLHDMFNRYTLENLKSIVKYLFSMLKKSSITPPGIAMPKQFSKLSTRKADRVEWTMACLKDPAVLRYIYDNMGDLEQAVLQETIHGSGAFDEDRFNAKYGAVPDMTIGYRTARRIADRDDPYSFPPLVLFIGANGFIPTEMQALLLDFVPAPEETRAETVDHLPETIQIEASAWKNAEVVPLVRHSTEGAATNDLIAVLQLADMGKIGVSAKTGRPTPAAVKHIRRVLSTGDYYPEDLEGDEGDVQMGNAGIRPFAWVMLLQAAGLAKPGNGKLVLSRTGKAALGKPAPDTLKRIWERWLNTKTFHEMSRIEVIKGQKSKKHPLHAAAPSRTSLAEALSELEEGAWIETDAFFSFLIAQGHHFDLVRGDGWGLYISEPRYGSLGYNHVTWHHVEGRFARAFLLEYAATLGIIDVALVPPWRASRDQEKLWGADELTCLSRYDGLYALRLNSLGAWILEQKAAYTPAFLDTPTLKVLPNLEITCPEEALATSDDLFIERFAERISGRAFRISLQKLLLAVEEGMDAGSMVTFLEDRSRKPLPQPVRAFFDDALNRVAMVQNAGEARLIKCTDRVVARRMARHERLRDLCMPAGDRYLVVPRDAEARFRKELRELGYVLAIQGA